MVERDRLDDVANEQGARADEPPAARGELGKGPQAVRREPEVERALLLERRRDGEEECRDKCEDLGQDAETLRDLR